MMGISATQKVLIEEELQRTEVFRWTTMVPYFGKKQSIESQWKEMNYLFCLNYAVSYKYSVSQLKDNFASQK